MLLIKARVKGYTRTDPRTGRKIQVGDYENKRSRQGEEPQSEKGAAGSDRKAWAAWLKKPENQKARQKVEALRREAATAGKGSDERTQKVKEFHAALKDLHSRFQKQDASGSGSKPKAADKDKGGSGKKGKGQAKTQLEGRGIPARLVDKVRRSEPGKGGEVTLTKAEVSILLKRGVIGLISAGKNPNDEQDSKLSDKEIDARTDKLKGDLVGMGLKFQPGLGKYGEEEDTFMIFTPDIRKEELVSLGEKYHQDSVIFSDGNKNQMIFTTGKNKGKHHPGNGFEKISAKAEDFFTEIDTARGKMRFSLNFNFGELAKAIAALAKVHLLSCWRTLGGRS